MFTEINLLAGRLSYVPKILNYLWALIAIVRHRTGFQKTFKLMEHAYTPAGTKDRRFAENTKQLWAEPNNTHTSYSTR